MITIQEFMLEARQKLPPVAPAPTKKAGTKKEVSSTDKPQTAEEEKAMAEEKPTTAKIPNRNISTFDTLKQFPDVLAELEEIAGGVMVSDEEFDNPDFNGLFYKTSNSASAKPKLCIGKGSSAESNLFDAGAEQSGASDMVIKLPCGAKIALHQSAKSKSFKYLKNTTDFQEAVIGALMQMRVDNIPIPVPTDKKKAKYPVQAWMESSDPVKKTGICKYIDYSVPAEDVEQFQTEINMILTSGNNGWRNCFEAIYKVDWKSEINKIFIHKPTWFKPLFIHDNMRLPSTVKASASKFLGKQRCGVQKDVVDKTDILLVFNAADAVPLMDRCMAFTKDQIPEHNEFVNEMINQGKMLGISMKQTGTSVMVAAVNFNIKTTAVGDNINDEYKVVVQIDPDDPNNCTFNCNKKNLVIPQFKPDVKTYRIDVPFNRGHGKDLHAGDGDMLGIFIREAGGTIQCNFGLKGAKAFFGKGNLALKEILPAEPNYVPIDLTAIVKKNIDAGKSVPEAVYEGVKRIASLIFTHPWTFTKIFAKSAGYPLAIVGKDKKGKKKLNYEFMAAPYMKVF